MAMSTSQLVLDYLEQNQPASCTKIGNALDISRANAHYHICQFMEQGLVEQLPQTNNNLKKGRPTHLYRVAKQAHPDTLMHLTGCLLAEIEAQNKTHDKKQQAMLRVARRMFPSLADENPSPPRLLNNIISILNERGYKARWETHREGPLITFRNCPYFSIIDSFPMMCQIDALILQELVGDTFIIANSYFITEAPRDSAHCRFYFSAQ